MYVEAVEVCSGVEVVVVGSMVGTTVVVAAEPAGTVGEDMEVRREHSVVMELVAHIGCWAP